MKRTIASDKNLLKFINTQTDYAPVSQNEINLLNVFRVNNKYVTKMLINVVLVSLFWTYSTC